jgi:hypothetical protein
MKGKEKDGLYQGRTREIRKERKTKTKNYHNQDLYHLVIFLRGLSCPLSIMTFFLSCALSVLPTKT